MDDLSATPYKNVRLIFTVNWSAHACSARSNSPFGQNISTRFAHKSTQGGQSLSYWLIYTILLTYMHVMAVITLHTKAPKSVKLYQSLIRPCSFCLVTMAETGHSYNSYIASYTIVS